MGREHELLDVHEMERMVARALVELIEDRTTAHHISARVLAARTKLPLRRVREVVALWELRTVSGDALCLTAEAVAHARTLASARR
jgi:hypothetical protein